MWRGGACGDWSVARLWHCRGGVVAPLWDWDLAQLDSVCCWIRSARRGLSRDLPTVPSSACLARHCTSCKSCPRSLAHNVDLIHLQSRTSLAHPPLHSSQATLTPAPSGTPSLSPHPIPHTRTPANYPPPNPPNPSASYSASTRASASTPCPRTRGRWPKRCFTLRSLRIGTDCGARRRVRRTSS